MNNIMIFEGNNVEVIELEGRVLFNAKNVGEVLGLGDSSVRKAIGNMNENQVILLKNSNVKESNFRKLANRGENFLTEAGVYKLAFRSNKESAERFTNWVAEEVLPQIRKTGGYIPIKENETELEIVSKALLIVNKTLEEKEKLLKEQKPLVDFANQISASEGSVEIGEFAKMINDNENIKIGRNRLFDWLRKNGYLMKNNIPYQRYIKNNYFEVIEKPVPRFDGLDTINKQTLITGKGQIKVLNKLKQSNLR